MPSLACIGRKVANTHLNPEVIWAIWPNLAIWPILAIWPTNLATDVWANWLYNAGWATDWRANLATWPN